MSIIPCQPRAARAARLCRAAALAAGLVAAAFAAGIAPPVAAAVEATVRIGYTPLYELLPVYVAKERGIFRAHGLDVPLTPISLNSNMPAAVVSKTVDLIVANATVFLTAIDAGIDIVAVAGDTNQPNQDQPFAYVTRTDVPFVGAKDLEGKKIALPGIGSSYDLLMRRKLRAAGADLKKVTFIEFPSAQVADVMRSKTIDGAVLTEPYLSHVLQSGIAKRAMELTGDLPDDVPGLLYAADREWAKANGATIREFRAALDEAIAFARAHPADARADAQHYLKLPESVLASLSFPNFAKDVTPAGLGFYVKLMKSENMLSGKIDPTALIVH